MADPVISIKGVSFSYVEENVLTGINADFFSGRIYGILGANGSGKTTMLDMLCGILSPLEGEILLYNKRVGEWKKRELARQVALVPQEFSIPFEFSVRQVVEMGRHPWLNRFESMSERDKEIVTRAMEELDVLFLAGRIITQLSGGEKQRVVTARALAQTPRVMILDESTSNLDIMHTISILNVLKRRVRNDGLTVIAAMHDINIAAMFCDELLFLKGGSVISSGAVDDVITVHMIERTYGLHAGVRFDEFAGAPQVSFRLEDM